MGIPKIQFKPPDAEGEPKEKQMIRLQKYLADCGIASRRACEKIISEGRVKVNGKVLSSQGCCIDENKDIVSVDGKRVHRTEGRAYYALYKPRGVICSCRDERGRRTVLDLMNQKSRRLYPVGRLDYDSEGLVIMTDDGTFANRMMHPSNHVQKRYQITIDSHYGTDRAEEIVQDGVDIGDGKAKAKAVGIQFTNREDGRATMLLVLEEGRNRQARKMLEAQGYRVLRLKRTQIGCLELGDMKPGSFRKLSKSEVDSIFRNPKMEQGMKSAR